MAGIVPAELSVVVVSYNTRELLARCLSSVASASRPMAHEVIVVDNASRDGSVEMVERQFPCVRVIANAANLGFARGANQGIRASHREFVALLNSDAEAAAGSLDALIAFLEEHQSAAAVGPEIRLPDGRPCQSSFRFPSLTRPYLNFASLRWIAGDSFSLSYPPDSPLMREGGEVDWLSGACLVLRRKALDQVGLLDEHFFMYFEDTDLCRRLHRAGWSVWYLPQVHMLHRVGQSGGGDRERLRLELRRSALHYYRLHHSRPVFWTVRALTLAAAVLRLAANASPRATERQIIRLALGAHPSEGGT